MSQILDSVLVVEGGEVFILEETVVDGTVLVMDDDELQRRTESIQGPVGAKGADGSGGSGGGEQDVPYAERVNFVGEDVIYKGYAQVGASESASVWRIKRLTIGADGDVSTHWAAGSAAFDKVWANHLALEYI